MRAVAPARRQPTPARAAPRAAPTGGLAPRPAQATRFALVRGSPGQAVPSELGERERGGEREVPLGRGANAGASRRQRPARGRARSVPGPRATSASGADDTGDPTTSSAAASSARAGRERRRSPGRSGAGASAPPRERSAGVSIVELAAGAAR
jgi:hypothetical protein